MDVVGEIEQNGAAVTTPGIDHLSLLGGRLCLDFVNTVDSRLGAGRVEYLRTYADLAAWAARVGAITDEDLESLRAGAGRRPAEARAALAAALEVREALYRLFWALAEDRSPEKGDLATFNSAVARTLARARIVPIASGFDWGWEDDPRALDRVLWPVVRSAAELLTTPDLALMRMCDAEGCGWLFVDATRNRSRRWCSMEGCGSRAKARRYYQRRKRGTGD